MKNQIKLIAIIGLFFIFSPAISKTFLWEVSSTNSKLYILGSIHVGNESMYPLNSNITDAFNNSNSIVVEVNMSKPEIAEKLQSLIIENAIIPEGKTIKDFITKEQFSKLQNEFEKLGLPETDFLQRRPWFVSISLLNMKMFQLGYKSDYGVDLYFLNQAKLSEKPIKELETVDSQVQLLASMSDDMQQSLLSSSLERTENYDKILENTIKYWVTGNTQGFLEMYFNDIYSSKKYKGIVQKIVYDRNIAMSNKIDEFLKNKEKCFVIIGAGHLLGEKGIISLLKKKGYKIKQM